MKALMILSLFFNISAWAGDGFICKQSQYFDKSGRFDGQVFSFIKNNKDEFYTAAYGKTRFPRGSNGLPTMQLISSKMALDRRVFSDPFLIESVSQDRELGIKDHFFYLETQVHTTQDPHPYGVSTTTTFEISVSKIVFDSDNTRNWKPIQKWTYNFLPSDCQAVR